MKYCEKPILGCKQFSAIILAVVFMAALSTSGSALAKEQVVSRESSQLLGKLSNALAEVAEVARPVVVNISTTSTISEEENPLGDMFNDPFFRHFFGDQGNPGKTRKHKSSALGSGVIVSPDGYILTNDHVVKGADEIKVILFDKREFKGKVVGTDPRTDLAVIKINAKDLPTIKIGDSSELKTGDIVLAVGNPFGLNQTITMGIVSAVGRSNIGLADFEDFIQTDAPINPGNSGGALVNSRRRTRGYQHGNLFDERRLHGHRFFDPLRYGEISDGQHNQIWEGDPRLGWASQRFRTSPPNWLN